jgi:hypothetical protein
MKGFFDSVASLPRMAKELNQARNNVEQKLKKMIDTLEVSQSITLELFKSL